MSRTVFRIGVCICLASFWGVHTVCLAESSASAEGPVHYETQIRPLLKAHCFHCHGEEKELSGGLDLRLQRFMVQGGESGPAIVPGHSDESLLIDYVRSGAMPP